MEPLKNMETFPVDYISMVHEQFGIAFLINDGHVTALEKDTVEEVS